MPDPSYVSSLGVQIRPDKPFPVEESVYYDNDELRDLVKQGLIGIYKSEKDDSCDKLEDPVEVHEKGLFGVDIPDDFENLHWKQQAKILNSIKSVDLFRVVLGVSKEGYFKELAKKKIIDLEMG